MNPSGLASAIFGAWFEGGGDAAFAVNTHTETIACANQRFADLVARSLEDVVGARLDSLVTDGTRARALLRPGESSQEIIFLRGDGAEAHLTVRGATLARVGFGELVAFLSSSQVLARGSPAEPLRAADAPLSEGELSQLVLELSEAKQHLEDRSEEIAALAGQVSRFGWRAAVGELVGGIAHHLNNPLGALASVQRRMDAKLGEIPDEPLRESLQRLSSQGRELVSRLETNVLALMRTQQLTAAPDAPRSLDLAEEVEAALTLFNGRLQRVMIVREYDRIPPVQVPQEALHLVLSHLIDNALRAMQERGTLTINICGVANATSVRVSDTGGGVTPELRARLFEPLLSARTGGAGLGLSTALRLARAWGGDLRYTPRPGGSTFEFRVPISAGIQVPDAPAAATVSPSVSSYPVQEAAQHPPASAETQEPS